MTSLALALLFVVAALRADGPGPVFAKGGPDATGYGQAEGYPIGNAQTTDVQKYQVGLTSHWDKLFPTNQVPRAETASSFRRAAEPDVHYDFGGRGNTLADYLAHVPATGLLIAQGDAILYEHYQYARTDKDRFIGNSMSKTLVSLLMGIAIGEGKIKSVDDPAAAYVPTLRNSPLGSTPLRTLLQMSSGIAFEGTAEDQFYKDLYTVGADDGALLAKITQRADPAGTKFHYSCGDTETVTTALRRAVGVPLARYLSEKIWKPIGAEGDGTWVVDAAGQEVPCWGFSATLRDYARLGRLLADDGSWNGRQLVPRQWMLDATTVRPADKHLAPGTAAHYYGYGYQLWILPGGRRMFALIGANGQYVFVDPKSGLVLVQTAVRVDSEKVTSPKIETLALWLALVRQLGDSAGTH